MAWKELTIDQWVDEIERGLEFRREYGLEDDWGNLQAFYDNVHSASAHEGPNVIASTADSMISSLIVPNPYISVKPTQVGLVEGARVVEQLDNQLVRDLGLSDEIERALLHAFLWSRAILKVGYDSEWGYDPELDMMGGEAGATFSRFDSKGRRIEFGKARAGMPWVRVVMPHDFVVPWGTVELEDAPWCVHRVVRHIEDVRADDKYEGTRSLEPNVSMRDFVDSYRQRKGVHRVGRTLRTTPGREQSSGKAEYVELWEIHERRTMRVKVVTSGHKRFLRNEIDQLQLDGLPFVSKALRTNARTFWTTPDAYFLKQAQLELSDIALMGQKQRRSSVPKIIAFEDVLDDSEVEKLMSADVAALVRARQVSGGSIRDAITTFNFQRDVGLLQEGEFTRRNAREVVGFSRNQQGEFEQSGRRTATESQIVKQSADIRLSRRQLRVRDLYLESMRKVNEIVFQFWTMPRIIEIVGEDGTPAFVSFTGSRIRGAYRYDLGFSNEGVETRAERRQQALGMYAALSADPTVDRVALARYLGNAFNDPELTRVFSPGVSGGSPNAGVLSEMQGLPGASGALPAPGRARGGAPMPMRGPDGAGLGG